MVSKKRQKRSFSGMSYREVQRSNTNRKQMLSKPEQKWLKENGYRNVGWDQVVKLYQKINDLQSSSDPDLPSLEDLFLKVDQIGSKYQTSEEIAAFNQALQTEVEEISNVVDQQFPDTDYEVVDYSQPSRKTRSRRYQT